MPVRVGRSHFVPAPATQPITLEPSQPFVVVYDTTTGLSAYNHPGAMAIAGRDNYTDAAFQAMAAAGGTVLLYLDAIVWNSFGIYHDLLFNSSVYGAAVPEWPGPVNANSTGNLADFRIGGTLQSKLEGVMQQMADDNPWIGGFFMDDVGSRSWFPNFNWSTFGSTNQSAYRAGAIGVVQHARNVADANGLIVIVNGTWTSGTLASNGGGYPTLTTHGCSLAEGGCIEHHDGESSFWGAYGDGTSQWGDASPITNGEAVCPVICSSSAGITEYAALGNFPFITNQTDYGITPTPWTTFHATGLPSHTS